MRPTCLLLALLALLPGCATPPEDAAFKDLQRDINDRIGERVEWDRNSSDDRAVEEAVRALLKKELTPGDAVQVALLNNHSLQATYEELGVAQADLVQAGLLQNPRFFASIRMPSSGVGDLDSEFSITQNFLDLFVMPLRKKIAADRLDQARLRVAQETLALAAEVEKAFYTVQAGDETLVVQHTIRDAAEASAELAVRQRAAGNISQLDLAEVQAGYEQTKLDVIRNEAELRLEREELTRLMGLDDGGWKAAPSLPKIPPEDPAPRELEKLAAERRLDVAVARGDVEITARALKLTDKYRFVGLEVGVDTEHNPEGNDVTGPQISLELPIFDQKQAAIAKLEAEYRQARQRLLAAEVEARSQVRSAADRLAAARTVAEEYRTAIIPQRERIAVLSQKQYNGMFLGAYQLLQTRQAQAAAYKEYIGAVRDYWIARAALAFAVGGKLPAPHPPTTQPQPQGEKP